MARLPQSRRLLQEDFKDQPWITPLLTAVNQFMDDVNSVLNQGVSLTDNMAGEIYKVECDSQFPIKLVWTFTKKPKTVVVGDWYRKDLREKHLVLSTTGGITSGSKDIATLASTAGLRAGLKITGTGIPDDTHIVSINSATALTMSRAASATTATLPISAYYDSAVQVRWSFNQANQIVIEDVVGIEPSLTTKYILIIEARTE